MRRTAFVGANIFDGERLHADSYLVVEDGRVVRIGSGSPPTGMETRTLHGGILSPGFLDVQVNGGGGILLNHDTSGDGMAKIAAAHRPYGTTGLLPTLITDTRERTRQALDAAVSSGVSASDGVMGLHLEGPHLDPRRKGAHLAELMGPVTDDDLRAYTTAADKLEALVLTVAANQITPRQVSALTEAGAIVSIGHSECTANEAEALFDAGARGVTHLFNAMSGLGHREPGLVGAALSRNDVWGGFIADGHHVDRRTLSVALAAKQDPGRLFLVTDAMALVGSGEGEFSLNGRKILRDKRGIVARLTLEDGTLAGADIDMATSIRFLVENVGLPVADALRRATADPADFLKLGTSRGRLIPGARADLVNLSDRLEVNAVWMAEEL